MFIIHMHSHVLYIMSLSELVMIYLSKINVSLASKEVGAAMSVFLITLLAYSIKKS